MGMRMAISRKAAGAPWSTQKSSRLGGLHKLLAQDYALGLVVLRGPREWGHGRICSELSGPSRAYIPSQWGHMAEVGWLGCEDGRIWREMGGGEAKEVTVESPVGGGGAGRRKGCGPGAPPPPCAACSFRLAMGILHTRGCEEFRRYVCMLVCSHVFNFFRRFVSNFCFNYLTSTGDAKTKVNVQRETKKFKKKSRPKFFSFFPRSGPKPALLLVPLVHARRPNLDLA